MTIKLKQPLRLATNISAFDPQTPLNLSSDMSSHISIPIADKSAVAGERVGKAKIVTGIPGNDGRAVRFGGTGVESFYRIWTIQDQRLNIVWSQPIIGYFLDMNADNGGNRIYQDLPENDEIHVREFQRWKQYWCLATADHHHFYAGVTIGISETWITGVF